MKKETPLCSLLYYYAQHRYSKKNKDYDVGGSGVP
jgi:hypothetical protein